MEGVEGVAGADPLPLLPDKWVMPGSPTASDVGGTAGVQAGKPAASEIARGRGRNGACAKPLAKRATGRMVRVNVLLLTERRRASTGLVVARLRAARAQALLPTPTPRAPRAGVLLRLLLWSLPRGRAVRPPALHPGAPLRLLVALLVARARAARAARAQAPLPTLTPRAASYRAPGQATVSASVPARSR